jgi:hypothetical protein
MKTWLQGRTLLEADHDDSDDFESYKLARDHYKACTNEDVLEELGIGPMANKLKAFGGWPVVEGDQVPVLPKVTNTLKLQIFVSCNFTFFTFIQYSLIGQVFLQ